MEDHESAWALLQDPVEETQNNKNNKIDFSPKTLSLIIWCDFSWWLEPNKSTEIKQIRWYNMAELSRQSQKNQWIENLRKINK